jgi:hypothetical protein
MRRSYEYGTPRGCFREHGGIGGVEGDGWRAEIRASRASVVSDESNVNALRTRLEKNKNYTRRQHQIPKLFMDLLLSAFTCSHQNVLSLI